MTKLDDIVDVSLLAEMLVDGYVSQRFHPDYPELAILNYTEKAAFERKWNGVTKNTRGLIYNTETYEVLARPFAKFHNFDEPEAPKIEWEQVLYHWANKEDGSLGILYRTPNGYPAIATRGSFASEQAIKGTKMLHDSGMAWVFDEYIDSGYTPLFEIIYPENRIVLNYGTQEYLHLLGYMHIASGAFVPANPAEPRKFGTLTTDLSRPNAEGWVAWLTPYKAVKIKQADYVELHRIVTGLNRKSIWRALKDGEPTFKALLEQLPDELYKWAEDVARELRKEYATIIREVDAQYIYMLELAESMGIEPDDRRGFALNVQRLAHPEYRGFMFSLLDGRDIQDKVWQMIEPKGGDK